MYKKLLVFLFILQICASCGFTPIYKMSTNENYSPKIHYNISETASYEVRQLINENLVSVELYKAEFEVNIKINEKQSAVNILANGDVSEYRIEVLISFEIINIQDQVLLYKSQSRGFANYDVNNSEYNNNLVKKEALRNATSDAIQLMKTIIQSRNNDQ